MPFEASISYASSGASSPFADRRDLVADHEHVRVAQDVVGVVHGQHGAAAHQRPAGLDLHAHVVPPLRGPGAPFQARGRVSGGHAASRYCSSTSAARTRPGGRPRPAAAQHGGGHDERDRDGAGADQVGEVVADVERGGRRLAGPAELGAIGRERGQHGEPERAADLRRGVDEARGQAGGRSAWRPTSRASSATGSRGRRRARAAPSAAGCRARSPRRAASANRSRAARISVMLATSVGFGAVAKADARGDAQRHRAHRQGRGQEREPDLERVVAEQAAACTARQGRTSRARP